MNFGVVRRTQLAKFTLLTSTLVPLGKFQIFKICSDAKEREWGAESNRTYSIIGKTAAWVPEFAVKDLPSAELQPGSLRLQCRTSPWAEDSDDYDDCDQNNLVIVKSILKIIRLYMSLNFYRKIFNVLLQNLMLIEHFEICVLKLFKNWYLVTYWINWI